MASTREIVPGRARAMGASLLEQVIELVLDASPSRARTASEARDLAEAVLRYRARNRRVVVLGGGTGMSTIVGGNSQLPGWTSRPFVGLKTEFGRVDVVGCTTDDGGSTGELLKHLPVIGIGDLRKSCISMVLPENLERAYGVRQHEALRIARVVQQMLNYRFPARASDRRVLKDPLLAVPRKSRGVCPPALASELRALGASVASWKSLAGTALSGHSLGNLLLVAAIAEAAGGRLDKLPSPAAMRAGLDRVARVIGATPGCLHAATAVPGQLSFLYMNGVEVLGQCKAGRARRGFPVDRVVAEYAGKPAVSDAVCRAIRQADMIIYAPGSLYSSMIPVLQLPSVIEAIRANRHAMKVLAANFWIQEGETDLSPGDGERGFLVSDLLEAYDKNIPGGASGLFDVVLCSNLEHLPGNILRNYALEGKRPIHLDRARVEAMGYLPVEATLFSIENMGHAGVIHHDADKFTLAVRTILYLRKIGAMPRRRPSAVSRKRRGAGAAERFFRTNGVVLSRFLGDVRRVLRSKRFVPAALEAVVEDLVWENRDIRPEHLGCFRGIRIIPGRAWSRSVEWDNVLGYFDPEDGYIKLHRQLLRDPFRLRRDLLIALGESLLGRYIESREWREVSAGSRCYEIRLRDPARRGCFLGDRELRDFLRLARMVQDAKDPRVFRLTINDDEGFLPSGLLFGLMFAWYLNNAYGGVMEYEMSLLRWPEHALVPHQVKERLRKQALVRFFRSVVFGHG